MKRPLLITALFLLLAELVLGWWLWAKFSSNTQRMLDFHQSELAVGFRSVIDSHRKLVEMSLHHQLRGSQLLQNLAEAAKSTDPVQLRRIRGRIYRMLYPDYAKLLEQHVRVLQFVLPDGRSLLRFNRPDLYDDRISDQRPLLQQVISTGKPGTAFENGRVYPGFRYVFPLHLEGELVALADFSLSYDGIRRSFMNSKQATGKFSRIVLRRDLLEAVAHSSAKSLFHPALVNPDFVVEDPQSPLKDIVHLQPLPAWMTDVDRVLGKNPGVQQAMDRGGAHSLVLCVERSGCRGVVLHPVYDSMGRAAAYIIAYTGMPDYLSERNQTFIVFVLGSLLFLLSATLLRRWIISRGRLQTISEHMGEGMYVVDLSGRVIYVNPAACSILGYGEQEIRGYSAHELFHSHSHDEKIVADQCPIRNVPLQGSVYSSDDQTFRHKDGRLLRISVSSSPLREHGEVSGAVVVFRDISDEYANRQRLRQADTALKQLAEGVLIADTEVRIVAVNKAFTTITGYPESDVLGRKPSILASGRHDVVFYREMWESILQKGFWQGEIWNRRKNGEIYPQWLKISAMQDDADKPSGYVGVFTDITEKRQNEMRLKNLAYRDQLTGLYNRTSFMELTEHALHRARRAQTGVALLFLDLDRFKRINDTLGHVAGDHLLTQVSERLASAIRGQDVFARLGGDEFTILLEDVPSRGSASHVARKILQSLHKPFHFESKRLDITASIGISLFPDDGDDGAGLLKHADAAMYLAKQQGRDRYHHFVKGMDHVSLDRFELERDLHRALEQKELTLFYQPKVAIPSGQLIGMEALIRWQHPERGLLTPFHFLGVAEEAGLMQQVTEQVLQMAARQSSVWKQQGHEVPRIAVNLDAQFLQRPEAEQLLGRIVEEAGIQPSDLELEIVETTILQDSDYIALCKRLVERGYTVAIDDFGTGESSLSRLKTIPVGVLKVDQSFVRDLEEDENDRAIVQTVIAMAHTLGKQVIAEGVENEEQLRFLYQSGCRMIQGYYFSRPVPAEQAIEFIQPDHFVAKAAAVGRHDLEQRDFVSAD